MKTLILIGALCILINVSCSVNENGKTNQNANPTPTGNIETAKTDDIKKTEIPPTADTLTVALTLLRQNKQTPTQASETFIKDDGVRLNISTVENGHLYVLYKGSSGATQVLFPNKDYFNGKNEIKPNKTLVIPNKGWFFFDTKKGTETVFVVYSKIRNSKILSGDAKENLNLLEKLQSENKSDIFTTDEGNMVRVIELKHQ